MTVDTCDPMHGWFGLSYASYLVLPRSLIQEMPEEWQKRMVELLEEWDEAVGPYCAEHAHSMDYDVKLVAPGERDRITDLLDEDEDTDSTPRYIDDPLAQYRHSHHPLPHRRAALPGAK